MPEQGRAGIIIGYNVNYRNFDDPSGWKNASCSSSLWCEISNLDFGTRYYVSVAGATVKGSGPSAHVEAQTDKAGEFINTIKIFLH